MTLTFSSADLQANRQGQVTAEQLRSIPRKLVKQGLLTIREVTGEIQTRQQYQSHDDDGPGKTVYVLDVDGVAFQVPSQAVVNACAERGARYRVYSLEEADRLWSIEVLAVPR